MFFIFKYKTFHIRMPKNATNQRLYHYNCNINNIEQLIQYEFKSGECFTRFIFVIKQLIFILHA